MRSFLLLTGGLLLAASSIFAAPVGNVGNLERRSLPSASLAEAVYARAIEHVTFGANVPADHHESIKQAINAHHDALAHDHEAKVAVKAHVMGTGWHETEDDPTTHATVGFYKAGARNSKNLLGGSHHVYKPT